jgi:polygalacturonase
MNFRVIGIFVRSVTFELINADIYSCKTPYRIVLNGQCVAENQINNIFSVFGLSPSTEYTVAVEADGISHEQTFTTGLESFRFNIRDFGAAGDGVTPDTAAIQAAILCCPKNGTVLIPRGVYYTSALFLKSNITVEIEEGAKLLGITNRREYPILPGVTPSDSNQDEYYLGSWEGNPLSSYASLLTGIDVENIDIIGKGVVDANADSGDWWDNPKQKRGAWRPRMLFLNNCRNVRVQGITLQNSYSWTIHPYYSQKISFMDIRIHNDPDSPNTDGIDIESCSDVEIFGAVISVGDDCIALKSGKMYLGKRLKTPSSNMEIRNCLLERGHGAVVIGSEVSAGVHSVRVTQCAFEGTDRGIRIKTRRGRGDLSVVDGILLENIRMNRVLTPFVINMFYCCDPDGHSELVWSKEKKAVDEFTPKIGSLTCKNVVCEQCSVAGMYFYGLPEMPVESIFIENSSLSFADDARPGYPEMMDGIETACKQGLYANNIKKLTLKNVQITGYEGKKYTVINVQEFSQEESENEFEPTSN